MRRRRTTGQSCCARLRGCPGEDPLARLLAALTALDEALKYRRPDTAPLDYAMTQNNWANLLYDLAGLPGEDRRARLLAALAAYDEALQFRRPDATPLDYAATQNNRAVLLRELGELPGEDRRGRLLAALSAYDEALQFRRPDTAPLDYAGTQNNRGLLLSELAGLPGEDRRGRLEAALAAYDEALKHYRPDTAPLHYAMTQGNLHIVFRDMAELPGEDRQNWLLKAGRTGWEAYKGFKRSQHAQYQKRATRQLRGLGTLRGEASSERAFDQTEYELTYGRRVGNMTLSQAQVVELNNKMKLYYSLDEIKALCFTMGIDFESLPGEGKDAKIRELIAFCQRRGRDEELVDKVRAERPLVAWPGVPATQGTPAG